MSYPSRSSFKRNAQAGGLKRSVADVSFGVVLQYSRQAEIGVRKMAHPAKAIPRQAVALKRVGKQKFLESHFLIWRIVDDDEFAFVFKDGLIPILVGFDGSFGDD